MDPGKLSHSAPRSDGNNALGPTGGPRNVTTPDRIRWRTGVRFDPHGPTDGQAMSDAIRALFALPLSSFSPEQRLQFVLLAYASDSGWLEISHDSMARVSFMILTGSLQPTLIVTRDQAVYIIKASINWERLIRDNQHWSPAEVQGIRVDPYTSKFSTHIDDEVFLNLLSDQLGQVPFTFFRHVRASIRRLLTPARFHPDPTRLVPQHLILGYMPEASMHIPMLCDRLRWDNRWGYELWHLKGNDTAAIQLIWFADRCVRDVVLHALKLKDSVGSFAVMIPEQLDLVSEVPCTLQTVSFVLAALIVELECIVGASCQSISEYVARFAPLRSNILSFLTSIEERNNVHLDSIQSDAAYWGLQGFLQLTNVDHVFVPAGVAHSIMNFT